jgi:hypothetical protein
LNNGIDAAGGADSQKTDRFAVFVFDSLQVRSSLWAVRKAEWRSREGFEALDSDFIACSRLVYIERITNVVQSVPFTLS